MKTIFLEQDKNPAYAKIGRLLVGFEQVNFLFKKIIAEILELNGLKKQIYADIFLCDLTAEPIKTIFQRMVPYHFKDEKVKSKINEIITLYGDLIELRNIIVHGLLLINVQQNDPSDISIIALKKRGSKKETTTYHADISDIEKICDNIDNFYALVFRLWKNVVKSEVLLLSSLVKTDISNIQFKKPTDLPPWEI